MLFAEILFFDVAFMWSNRSNIHWFWKAECNIQFVHV